MKSPSKITDNDIIDELITVSDGVDERFYAFVLEQIMYNLNISEYRVIEALRSFIAWKGAENTLEYIGRSFAEDTSALKPVTGHVYVFHHCGIYKIGISNDVKTRLASMNRAIPPSINRVELQFEFLVVNPKQVEKRLHNRFANKKISSCTGGQEWFRLSSSDLQSVFFYLEVRSVITERALQ